jgi:hypothetical protein
LVRAATGIVAETYESYSLERNELMKVGERKGSLNFQPLVEVVSHQGGDSLGQST